jgi:hypothetical protein
LIEGHISVSRTGEEAVDMHEPQTVLQAPSSGAVPPVAPVDPAQLRNGPRKRKSHPAAALRARRKVARVS